MNDLVVPSPNEFLAMVERLAKNQDVDPAKISAILDIQERMLAKRAEQEFDEAFQRLRSKLPSIKKGDIVDYGPGKGSFKFAKWEKVQAAIDSILAEEGFDLTFDSQVHPNGTSTIAILRHRGGHVRRASTPPLPLDTGGGKNNIQGAGSSMSYGQRYATKFVLNLRFEDDDDGVLGGMVFIDEKKVQEIEKLLEETKSNRDTFLQTMGAVRVENIPLASYTVAVNLLMAKKRNMR